jgi:hypothetical protein
MKKPELSLGQRIVVDEFALGTKLFEFPTNRPCGYSEELAESFRNYGVTDSVKAIKTDLIDGVEKLYLVDGHHRAKTASMMNMSYYVDIITKKFSSKPEIVKFITTINNSQKPWHINDYIRVYSKIGMPEYNKLIALKSGNPYSLYTIAMMSGKAHKGSLTDSLKLGTFRIIRESQTKKTIDFAKELLAIGKFTNRMVISLNRVMSMANFDEEKFKENFKKYHFSIKTMSLDNYDDLFISWLQ